MFFLVLIANITFENFQTYIALQNADLFSRATSLRVQFFESLDFYEHDSLYRVHNLKVEFHPKFDALPDAFRDGLRKICLRDHVHIFIMKIHT